MIQLFAIPPLLSSKKGGNPLLNEKRRGCFTTYTAMEGWRAQPSISAPRSWMWHHLEYFIPLCVLKSSKVCTLHHNTHIIFPNNLSLGSMCLRSDRPSSTWMGGTRTWQQTLSPFLHSSVTGLTCQSSLPSNQVINAINNSWTILYL